MLMSILPMSHGRLEGKGSIAEAVSSARSTEEMAGTLQNM